MRKVTIKMDVLVDDNITRLSTSKLIKGIQNNTIKVQYITIESVVPLYPIQMIHNTKDYLV